MEIKVLGPGCPNCKTLETLTRTVVEEKGIDANITKVDDIMEIVKLGVLKTPGLMVDGEIILKGRVPSRKELEELLTK